MKKVFFYGQWQEFKPAKSTTIFPKSNVEPDGSMTIRQIYDAWTKGKPTSVHPMNIEYDEEGSDFDDSDSYDDFRENPVDRCQPHNDVVDAKAQYDEEVEVVAQYQKRSKQKREVTQSNDKE